MEYSYTSFRYSVTFVITSSSYTSFVYSSNIHWCVCTYCFLIWHYREREKEIDLIYLYGRRKQNRNNVPHDMLPLLSDVIVTRSFCLRSLIHLLRCDVTRGNVINMIAWILNSSKPPPPSSSSLRAMTIIRSVCLWSRSVIEICRQVFTVLYAVTATPFYGSGV